MITENYARLSKRNERLKERVKALEEALKQIQTLNAKKDNDIEWLCDKALKNLKNRKTVLRKGEGE